MTTPSGIARASFLSKGIKLVFGSLEEGVAMMSFNREREVLMTLPIMAGADNESFNKILKIWKANIYPEIKMEDIKTMKQYSEQFKKLNNLELYIEKM